MGEINKQDRNSEVERIHQGARIGAAKKIGAGTRIHTPESIANEAVLQFLEQNRSADVPNAYGYRMGKLIAVGTIRRQSVERRHAEHVGRLAGQAKLYDGQQQVDAADERRWLFERVLELPTQYAAYIFLGLLTDASMEEVALVFDVAYGKKVTVGAHRHRLLAAKRRLRETL